LRLSKEFQASIRSQQKAGRINAEITGLFLLEENNWLRSMIEKSKAKQNLLHDSILEKSWQYESEVKKVTGGIIQG